MMKNLSGYLATLFLASVACGQTTSFSYTQTDVASGSGTVVAPAPSLWNGVTITWDDATMPNAAVRDPSGAGSSGGAVGGFAAANGGDGVNGEDVALYWNDGAPDVSGTPAPRTVQVFGTGDDGNDYSLDIPLVFAPPVLDGVNDYTWSLEYGDILGTDPNGSPRTAMWFSPTWALGLGNRAQRYTQTSDALDGVLMNTDMTTGSEKDGVDGDGQAAGATAAVGLPLEFGFGWRDGDSVVDGPVLIDNYSVGGLLAYDEANIRLVPEPNAALLLLLGLGGVLAVRRRVG